MSEPKIRMTDKKIELMEELKAKEKRTTKQQETLDELVYTYNNPQLSEGAKNYCQLWLKEQIYNRTKEFTSKYTDKGNEVEQESINFASEHLGWGMCFKNEKYFENDYMTGTPDIVLSDKVIDMKNNWDCFTFPLFDTEPDQNYEYQLQGYMELSEKENALLVHTLMDTPDLLIQDEIRRYSWKHGMIDLPAETEQEIMDRMVYKDVPIEKRIKVFELKKNQETIDRIKKRVLMCRNYIETLK
jgi:hypothetical protein